MTTVESILTTS